jgi:cell division septal protein FtsQ
MKIVGSDKAIRSPEFHKRKLRERRLKVALVILALVIIAVGPILLLRNTRFLITDVSVAGNEVTSQEEIKSVAWRNLAGMYLWVIPKTSSIFYPRTKIEEELKISIPRLASTKVSLSGMRGIDIAVTERKPASLYCQGEEKVHCYFLDDTGFIFSEAPDFFGEVYIRYKTIPEIENPIRTQLFAPEEYRQLDTFLGDITNLGIVPKTVVKTDDEFELIQPHGPTLKWRQDQNLEHVLVDLESFLHNSGLKQSDISRMSYIDLRFDSKVFYRFQGE